MVEPDKKDHDKTADLEDTVRNLREENAKLLQLLRSQGLLLDSPLNQNGKSTDGTFAISQQQKDSTNIIFDHSDLTLTTQNINTANQINHQHVANHGPINQQTYNTQTIHGNQSNITPNFNTVIQTTSQPFVQNSSNTLVQNNTNLIQPINLVNFNNVSLDSIQSFFASKNNVVYLSQQSSTTPAATTTATNSIINNTNLNEPLSSTTHSTIPSTSSQTSTNSEKQNKIIIRPKLSLLHQNKELVPVIPKIKPEHYESLTRKFSSLSNNNDLNSFGDSDSNDSSKQKYARPMRPKISLRISSSRVSNSNLVNKTRKSSTRNLPASSSSSSFVNNSSSKLPLFSSSSCVSQSLPTTHYLSQSSIQNNQIDLGSIHSKSLDLCTPSNNNLLSKSLPIVTNKKSSKPRVRNKKKISAIVPPNGQASGFMASNMGRTLATTIGNVSRIVTSNNPISKRSTTNKKQAKRNNSKAFVHSQSENILQQDVLSPINLFAESISGLLENFDQELIASNFLTEATTNLGSGEHNSIISSNTNTMQTSDHTEIRRFTDGVVQQQETCSTTTTMSMPTLEEFHNQLGSEIISTNNSCNEPQIIHCYNVENEHITFISEEDMRFVEMNFDENVFLKQFDLDDPGIKNGVHSDQNFFATILTSNSDLSQTQQNHSNQQSKNHQNQSVPSAYSNSSLINNSVFTTVVPLGSQPQPCQTNAFINNSHCNSTISLLPEEGVQLTARHIEPSQVATYESAKYQDILDDLVMVTDQDVLQHAQATAANDSSIESTDFSLVLLEAANEIIASANIQLVEANSSTFTELQYFYPIEQEQANLEKQLEMCQNTEQNLINNNQQPIVVLEKLQSQIIVSTNLPKDTPEESTINASANDLSSILQLDQLPPSNIDRDRSTTTDLLTPVRPTKNISHLLSLNSPPPPRTASVISISTKSNNNSNDNNANIDITIDSHLPLLNPLGDASTTSCSSVSDTLVISSNALEQQLQSIEPINKSNTLYHLMSSSPNSSSVLESSETEMIIDSGRLDEFNSDKTRSTNDTDGIIEELLDDATDNQLEIVENQGKTTIQEPIIVDNVDDLVEQIEASRIFNSKSQKSFEKTFLYYRDKYYLNMKHQQNSSSLKLKQQLEKSTAILKVPSQITFIEKNEQDLPSSPKETDEDSIESPLLKIKIPVKLPSKTSEDINQNEKIHTAKKQKSNHSNHVGQQNESNNQQTETEYTDITHSETPVSQIYHQTAPPTPAETITKDETSSSPLLTSQQTESDLSSENIHSGFMIDEQTPPSSITSTEHKLSPPPLLINQTKTGKFQMNYSHIFDYDNSTEHQNNNTFITPPPETEHTLSQQKSNMFENFCQFSKGPNKKKHNRRKSSVTSSTSSKSLSNLDYAIDTQELEPVSPTPLTTPKKHRSQHKSSSSSSSSNYNDISPPYYEHQHQKHTKEHHSRKSSSNRSSRITTSQMYPQSRSFSNHSYRTSQEPPIIPPMIPVPPPPIHMDPYSQSYHTFTPRAAPPFFNFPFPHPFINPHSAAAVRFHPHSMKYPRPHSHHLHSSHGYPPQYAYHPHMQRQQQYNNSNHMSSRDHHSFDR